MATSTALEVLELSGQPLTLDKIAHVASGTSPKASRSSFTPTTSTISRDSIARVRFRPGAG